MNFWSINPVDTELLHNIFITLRTKYWRMDQVKICGRQPLKCFKWYGLLLLEYFVAFLAKMSNDFKNYDKNMEFTSLGQLMMTWLKIECPFRIRVETRLKNVIKSKLKKKSWCGNTHSYLSRFLMHLACDKKNKILLNSSFSNPRV